MIVVIGIALLLLAVAVVTLFAMIGELASRTPGREQATAILEQVADVKTGAMAEYWPGTLSRISLKPRSALVVLSTTCSTCNHVAAEFARYEAKELEEVLRLGVVVSCGSSEVGEQFVTRHSLNAIPHAVDEGGAWVTGTFGVTLSPTVLLFEESKLSDAYMFNKFEPLRNRIMAMAAMEVEHG